MLNYSLMSKPTNWTLEKVLPWILLLGGAIGIIAMSLLATEVFQHLKKPSFVPICNLNPILSCTSVANSWQAHALGYPNYFLGIAGFTVIATTGAAMLAGAKFKRWFWKLTELGLLLAILFVTWLQYQTLYRVGALCLFCLVGWVAIMPVFWYTTLYNLRAENIKTPKKLRGAVAFMQRYHLEILTVWFLIIIALILKRFWYYWSTVL